MPSNNTIQKTKMAFAYPNIVKYIIPKESALSSNNGTTISNTIQVV